MALKPKSATATEIVTLRKQIRQADKDYHAKGNKKTQLTDKQYDALKRRLETLAPNDPLLKKVGHVPTKRADKVTLPTFMGSLDKIYIDEEDKLAKWIKRYLKAGTFIVSDKLDGISALLINDKGKLRMFTRGDGSVGTEITHLIPYLKHIPKLKEGQQVRGEIVVSKAAFKKFAKTYENPRNLAAGIANKTKTVHEAANSGEFIIHEMISPKASLPRVASQLERMGGKVVNYKTVRTASLASIMKLLEATHKATKYDVDGIVIDNGKGEKIAIKRENEIAITGVREVSWQISRHGYLTPVVILDPPVRLAGVTIKQATGFNAKFIKENKLGVGSTVSIIRAGEVIPKITEVIKGTKAQFPPRGTWEWVNDTNIRSTDAEVSDTVEIKRMVYFLTTIGVKSFKDNLISVLFQAGITSPEALIKASAAKFKGAGLGETQANNLYKSIQERLKVTSMPQMMVASQIFPRGFGLTAAKTIWNHLGSKAFSLSTNRLAVALEEMEGLGEKTMQGFYDKRNTFLGFLGKIKWEPAKQVSKKLSGVVFAFTGFRDAKLQTFLENNGASVSATISKKVTHLIVKDKSFKSDKVTKAKELKIKIITAEEARHLPQTYRSR